MVWNGLCGAYMAGKSYWRLVQADVAENVKKQSQLMGVISQNQAAYKQTFGYNEWRSACEVHPSTCPCHPSGFSSRAVPKIGIHPGQK